MRRREFITHEHWRGFPRHHPLFRTLYGKKKGRRMAAPSSY
jgi:hypothetical protein